MGAGSETGSAGDPVTRELVRLLGWCGERVAAARAGEQIDDAVRVDRIGLIEQLKAALAALQMAESVRFTQSRVAGQQADHWDPANVGKGIADQVALACHLSPVEGSRRLGVARALWFELPGTFALLSAGRMSEYAAQLVVTETRHLDQQTRRQVDAQLITDRIDTLGVRAVAQRARARAYEADPYGFVQRGRIERSQRRVGLRPAPDTMAILTAYLPVEQGVACYAALSRHTDSLRASGDGRSRGQLMCDTLVERLTGHVWADAVNFDVRLVMSSDTLRPTSSRPAWLPGHGPLPAPLARDLLAGPGPVRYRVIAEQDLIGAAAAPQRVHDGRAVGVAAPAQQRTGPRRYTGRLRDLVEIRDHTCRDPYCDAPIRQIDHIVRHTDGGPTTLTNARGVCERGNYLRELPGWILTPIDNGPPHTTMITTPTGHSYTSQAPQPP